MPEFTFAEAYDLTYPETRDGAGHILGTAHPGDIREFDVPPDHHWRETADEDRAALAAREAGEEPAAGDESDGSTPDSGGGNQAGDTGADQEGDAPDPAGPQAVPPAVIPQ